MEDFSSKHSIGYQRLLILLHHKTEVYGTNKPGLSTMSKRNELGEFVILFEELKIMKENRQLQDNEFQVLKQYLKNSFTDLLADIRKYSLKQYYSGFEEKMQKLSTSTLNYVHSGDQPATSGKFIRSFPTIRASVNKEELDNKNVTKQNQNFKTFVRNDDTIQSVDHSGIKGNINEDIFLASANVKTLKNSSFSLTEGKMFRKSMLFANYQAIFRNSSFKYLSGDTHVLMPDDYNSCQEETDELLTFLSKSHGFSSDVEMPQVMHLTQEGPKGPYHLEADITTRDTERHIRLRLHVVSREAFENALRDNDIGGLELTYINIFPSNCRMFIGLPISKGSFLDRKDRQV